MRVPMGNQWQTIKKARSGVPILASHLLELVGDTGIEPATSTVSRWKYWPIKWLYIACDLRV
jgi:hypothetical protein